MHPRHRRAIARGVTLGTAAAALVAAAALFIAQGSFVLTRVAAEARTSHLDFETFWLSARALLDGGDIYATGAAYPNLNPPLLSVLLAPLGLLDFLPGYRAMLLITLVLVVGSVAAVAAELQVPARDALPALAAVLLSSPVIASLGLGQIYALLAAGLTAAWLLDRRDRPVLAGVALGLVVALKPSLAPLLLVPLMRRRWDTLAGAIAAGGGATAVAVAIAGPASLPTWIGLLAGTPTTTYFDNASLPGALLRLTSVNDWGRPLVEVPGGALAGLLIGLVLIGGTAWAARREPAGPDTSLWAIAAAALLTSPLTWHNYLMVLMPGVLVLIARGARPAAVLLLSLTLIGMEWPPFWYGRDGTASAVPLTLYTVILLTYWWAFLPRREPALDLPQPRPAPVEVPAEPRRFRAV